MEYHPDKNSSSHAKEVFQPLGSNLIAQVPQVLWRGWMGFFTGHPKCVYIYISSCIHDKLLCREHLMKRRMKYVARTS